MWQNKLVGEFVFKNLSHVSASCSGSMCINGFSGVAGSRWPHCNGDWDKRCISLIIACSSSIVDDDLAALSKARCTPLPLAILRPLSLPLAKIWPLPLVLAMLLPLPLVLAIRILLYAVHCPLLVLGSNRAIFHGRYWDNIHNFNFYTLSMIGDHFFQCIEQYISTFFCPCEIGISYRVFAKSFFICKSAQIIIGIDPKFLNVFVNIHHKCMPVSCSFFHFIHVDFGYCFYE